jgi:hypothetical protein
VNNDTLGALAGAFLFYLAVRISRDPGAGWLTLVSIPLAILLPFITKLSVLPVSAAVLMTIAGNRIFRQAKHAWLVISAVVLLGAGIVSLLFPELIRMAQHEIQWRLFTFRENALTGEYIRFITSQIVWTYWGKVGWLAVGPPAWIIHLLTGLGLAGMVLHAIGLVRAHRDKPTLITWMAIWGTALLTILAVFRNALATRATQGRLLFPAIGALSLLMVAGWHEILPPRMQPFLPAIVVLLLVSVNIVLWLTGVLPIYYQPLFD